MRSRRWSTEGAFLQALELLRLEREERRKAEARDLHAKVRLGVASADELRQFGTPSRIGRVG